MEIFEFWVCSTSWKTPRDFDFNRVLSVALGGTSLPQYVNSHTNHSRARQMPLGESFSYPLAIFQINTKHTRIPSPAPPLLSVYCLRQRKLWRASCQGAGRAIKYLICSNSIWVSLEIDKFSYFFCFALFFPIFFLAYLSLIWVLLSLSADITTMPISALRTFNATMIWLRNLMDSVLYYITINMKYLPSVCNWKIIAKSLAWN